MLLSGCDCLDNSDDGGRHAESNERVELKENIVAASRKGRSWSRVIIRACE